MRRDRHRKPAFTALGRHRPTGLQADATATMVARVLREGILSNYNWDRAPTVWERNRKALSVSAIFILAAAAGFLIFG